MALFSGGKSATDEYAQAQENLRQKLEETDEALNESSTEHESNIKATKQSAKEATNLINEIADLQNAIEDETAAGCDASAMKTELKNKLSQLNSTVDDATYAYDENANSLSASTDEMKAYVKQASKSAEVSELIEDQTEKYNALCDVQTAVRDASDTITEANEAAKKAQEDYNKAIENGTLSWQEEQEAMAERDIVLAENDKKIKEAQKTIEEWKPKLSEYQIAWEETSKKVVTAQDELTTAQDEYNTLLEESANDYSLLETAALQAAATQYQANQEMLSNGTLTYDQLSEKNQELVDKLNETWDMYYEANTNMWGKLADDSNLSVQEMIDNMRANQEATEQMATNMGTLRDKFASLGLDTAVLDQLESLGIESANEIANLAATTPEQLTEFADAFTVGGEKATTNLTTGLGTAADNLDPTIQGLVGKTEQGLSNAIANADWAELGEATIEGIVEGIDGMSDDAVDAVTEVAKEGYKGYKAEIQSGSPSKVYAGYGEDQMTGLILGVNNKRSLVFQTLQSVAQQIQEPFRPLNSIFTSYGMYTMSGFINGLESMRSSVVATAQSIANAVSSIIHNALKIGSPSKFMYQYGAWTGEGFENGLESRISPLEKLSNRIADVMTDIFVPRDFERSYGADLSLAGGFTYSMDGFTKDIASIIEAINNRPIQIDNRLDIDGKTFAKSTTPYITQEQNTSQKFSNYRNGVR